MLGGTLISMLGYLSGDALCTPRNIYAFARDGFIPAVFARLRPVSRAPQVAIWTHAALVFAVANSGSFQSVAIVANVATFALYLMAAVASLRLVRHDVHGDGPPFAVPGATLIALLAVAAVIGILASATAKEFGATAIALAIASLLYRWRKKPGTVR